MFCRAAWELLDASGSGEKVATQPYPKRNGSADGFSAVGGCGLWTAKDFGKGILLSLARGVGSSEGTKQVKGTYKSSLTQLLSEMQVLVHCFQIHGVWLG